jgi:orotidine-5'-phosphate decarboxylase
MAPGIQLGENGDSLGQKYNTPETAIYEKKCDVVIVGRGILSKPDPIKAAIEYKNLAFNAYLKRVSSQ